ncbi:hypothetical protein [Acetobacter fabarum]|uniref:hypothetical protein n=1 Tax=Acetobacter fabarum TaxID=483199 RepID=UPI0039EC8EB6
MSILPDLSDFETEIDKNLRKGAPITGEGIRDPLKALKDYIFELEKRISALEKKVK